MRGEVRIAATPWARMRGLLGHDPSWLGPDGVLVFVPCSSIHTFGMKEPIDVAFVDKKGKVIAVREGLQPRRLMSCSGASLVLERFADQASTRWFFTGEKVAFSVQIRT